MYNILQEIEKFCKEYELDFSKVEMDSDGLVIYKGDMKITCDYLWSDLEVASEMFFENPIQNKNILSDTFERYKTINGDLDTLRYFKSIYGDLEIKKFTGKVLNLENLNYVQGFLIIRKCFDLENIISKNLETLGGGVTLMECTSLKSFDWLKNLKQSHKIHIDKCKHFKRMFNFNNPDVTIFNLIFVDCENLTDISALKNIKNFQNISLVNFKGCRNLKSLNGLENFNIPIENFRPDERYNEYLYLKNEIKLGDLIQKALDV